MEVRFLSGVHMFPISDTIKSSSFPILTLLLIAANIYVFYLEITSPDLSSFISSYALIPSVVNFSNPSSLFPFLSAMFLHGGFFHIISNMWFLWVFGDNVEDSFGKLNFLVLFIGGGLVGNILQYVLNPDLSIPMLGASGAVSAILGAYYILFPHSRIKSVVPIIFVISIVEIPAVIYLFYWFFVQLFSGISTLGVSSQTGGVAFWAHIGGFVTGVVFAKSLKTDKEKKYIEGEILS